MSEQRWVDTRGICLRYSLEGAGSAMLVLVHEMCGAIESWDECALLLKGDYRILRYDQRGFGLSEKSAITSIDIMVEDLVALLDAIGVAEPVFFAGAALGAAICIELAARHPDRVRGLVISSPATGAMPQVFVERMLHWAELVKNSGMRAVTDAMLAVTYPAALAIDPGTFTRHRCRWLAADPESFIGLIGVMTSFDISGSLSRVKCSTLVIGCTYDMVRPAARSAELAGLIENATYREVPSGHYLPIQTPVIFVSLLRSFASVLPNPRVIGHAPG